jgi:hypothetical protein|tara:strand:- start:1312 stop:1656 length:345 start_codon:yes stop_codon:yes gene_type:complete
MNLAREINNKLDEILLHQETLRELEEDYKDPDFDLVDEKTGEKVTKEIVLNKAEKIRLQIIEDLNKITNNGNNVRDLFTNDYYVNDVIQDKEIAERNKVNKFNNEIQKQSESNN